MYRLRRTWERRRLHLLPDAGSAYHRRMIIVAGYLRVDPAQRGAYLDTCVDVMRQARATEGCFDFGLSADLLESDRINIYERWATREALDEFRGSGTDDEQGAQILGADVREFFYDREVAL